MVLLSDCKCTARNASRVIVLYAVHLVFITLHTRIFNSKIVEYESWLEKGCISYLSINLSFCFICMQ